MNSSLLDLVRELNTLNDDNLADRVIANNDVQWCLSELQDILEDMPTLTPPNEWVSVETPPTTQGWYHVAVLDLKTGKYTVEQDLYSIELAKAHGFEPGFCKANRWKERERIDYWCRFPTPPDRRPPEGEDET